MCGIYGTTKYYLDNIINKKLQTIGFRGPDYSAFKRLDGDVTLGHNRLSIIDLNSRSHQPLAYQHLSIVFNGEVYNFNEIKENLYKNGYSFKTNSDTEVIAAAYLAYGKDCVSLFNGMFAFVIYDQNKRELFGARDRLGQKPFYYTLKDNAFEFASQLEPIKLDNSLALDQTSIQQYLFWKCIPEPNSIYQEVKKLCAGHCFTYNLIDRKYKSWKYWDIGEKKPFEGDYETAKSDLSNLLKDSVKQRMIADVPLGVFLSGGIDSSLIAALSQEQSSSKIRTFSVKFQESRFDESVYASQVANKLGTNHTTIDCSYKEGIELIDNLVEYYQEPFADPSALPSMLLAKHTKKHVTVALSGDAGDENFLGYARYQWLDSVQMLYRLPISLRKLLGIPLSWSTNYRHKLIAKGIQLKDIQDLYLGIFSNLTEDWILQPSLGKKTIHNHLLNSNKNIIERAADLDLKLYLNDMINTKVDRASMASSLEVRAPFLDYRVVEFASSLPMSFKFQKGNQKRILKDILYQYLPKDIFARPKMGFSIPLELWFRKELKEYVLDILSTKNLKNLPGIHVENTQLLIKEHLEGKANHFMVLWTLIVLHNWMEKDKSSNLSPIYSQPKSLV